MSFIRQLERFEQLDLLIKRRTTGSADCLARKLNISRSLLYELLKTLKARGAKIRYSRRSNSYYYEEPFTILFG
ncbi:HTH domain-containing protein [Carboxylicivirga sp. RSCT41]|uniref:HTH domain-containing protein n=1 Tax=Carboxylicivirga agarovorans TaxID=3417570 RepID=UPI003D34BF51